MLNIMETISRHIKKGDELNIGHYENIIDFIKGFVDQCHHGKEEEILFPALISHGMSKEEGPIRVMLYEHQVGRNHIRELNNALTEFKNGNKEAISRIIDTSMNYVLLLRSHIEKENNVLFMMADGILSETEQSGIADAFEKLETEKIGIGKHEKYHELLKELKIIYLQ